MGASAPTTTASPLLSKPSTRHLLPPSPSPSAPRRRVALPTLRCSSGDVAPQHRAPSRITFQTLGDCKLGISRYPDFDYDATGGSGTAACASTVAAAAPLEISFDVSSLRIPALTSATTRFLGLPLPPFLRIDIVPELLDGIVDGVSGKVQLEFRAKFWFSIGSIYRAPALLVGTRLTTEESWGKMRGGKGERMDGGGRCRLVGVASVDPIGDLLMDTFLGLPTECLAVLNARIQIIQSDITD